MIKYLYRVELSVNDLDHPLNLLGSDRPCPRLLSQQVHHMRCELVAGLVVLFQLLKQDSSTARSSNFKERLT